MGEREGGEGDKGKKKEEEKEEKIRTRVTTKETPNVRRSARTWNTERICQDRL